MNAFRVIAGDFGSKGMPGFLLERLFGHPPILRLPVVGHPLKRETVEKDQVEYLELVTDETLTHAAGSAGWKNADGTVFAVSEINAKVALDEGKDQVGFVCVLKDGRKFVATCKIGMFNEIQALIDSGRLQGTARTQPGAGSAAQSKESGSRKTDSRVKTREGILKFVFGCVALAGIVSFGVMIISTPKRGPSSAERIAAAQAKLDQQDNEKIGVAVSFAKQMRAAARNPDSIVFEKGLWMQSGAFCYLYRGQNGFGGMSKEVAVSVDGVLYSSESPRFKKVFKEYCDGGEVKEDITYVLNEFK